MEIFKRSAEHVCTLQSSRNTNLTMRPLFAMVCKDFLWISILLIVNQTKTEVYAAYLYGLTKLMVHTKDLILCTVKENKSHSQCSDVWWLYSLSLKNTSCHLHHLLFAVLNILPVKHSKYKIHVFLLSNIQNTKYIHCLYFKKSVDCIHCHLKTKVVTSIFSDISKFLTQIMSFPYVKEVKDSPPSLVILQCPAKLLNWDNVSRCHKNFCKNADCHLHHLFSAAGQGFKLGWYTSCLSNTQSRPKVKSYIFDNWQWHARLYWKVDPTLKFLFSTIMCEDQLHRRNLQHNK